MNNRNCSSLQSTPSEKGGRAKVWLKEHRKVTVEQLYHNSDPPAVDSHHDECLHSTLSGYT